MRSGEAAVFAVFGFEGWEDLARVGALELFGLALWWIARAMTRELIG